MGASTGPPCWVFWVLTSSIQFLLCAISIWLVAWVWKRVLVQLYCMNVCIEYNHRRESIGCRLIYSVLEKPVNYYGTSNEYLTTHFGYLQHSPCRSSWISRQVPVVQIHVSTKAKYVWSVRLSYPVDSWAKHAFSWSPERNSVSFRISRVWYQSIDNLSLSFLARYGRRYLSEQDGGLGGISVGA